MSYVATQQLVDPERLLIVTLHDAGLPKEVAAVSCRYVPAIDANGLRAVAVEVVFDPAQPAPSNAYFCSPQQLQQLLVDPRAIRRIRPYVTG